MELRHYNLPTLVEKLLKAGADPDSKSENGFAMLHYATMSNKGFWEVVKKLVENGVAMLSSVLRSKRAVEVNIAGLVDFSVETSGGGQPGADVRIGGDTQPNLVVEHAEISRIAIVITIEIACRWD